MWIDGGREIFFSGFFFFFWKLLPQLFQAAMFNKRITTPPHTPTETIVIRSDQWEVWAVVPKATALKGLSTRWGRLSPVSQALVGAWALERQKEKGQTL